jgi:1-acyl-sn-glycerol-3-phosphate acyltransferase
VITLPPSVPATGARVTRAFGRMMMSLTGWRFSGTLPDLPKFVIIVAPHTSNWDFVVGVYAKLALGLDAMWIGKHTLFRWPLAPLLRRLGGVPVVRDKSHNVVAQVVAEFSARERMVFALAPEGTRAHVEQWRSGYWHIARQAGVPIVPVGLDYASKTVAIGEPLVPGAAIEPDEKALQQFFTAATASNSKQQQVTAGNSQ